MAVVCPGLVGIVSAQAFFLHSWSVWLSQYQTFSSWNQWNFMILGINLDAIALCIRSINIRILNNNRKPASLVD